MPILHATLEFASGQYGWVEQFFRRSDTLSSGLDAALVLAQARYSILGTDASLYRVRVSEVSAPKVSMAANVSGTPLPILSMPPILGAGLDVVAGQGGLYHQRYVLRGLPQGALVQTPLGWAWSPAIAGPVARWLGLLSSQGWLLQCWGRTSPRYPIGFISAIAPFPPLTLAPDPPFVSPAFMGESLQVYIDETPQLPEDNPDTGVIPTARVGRAQWYPAGGAWDNGINGQYEVLGIGPGVVYLLGPEPPEGYYNGGGYLQLRPRLYLPIRGASMVGLRAVKCGPAKKRAMLTSAPTPAPVPVPATALPKLAAATLAQVLAPIVTPFKTSPDWIPGTPPLVVPPPPFPPPPPPFTPAPAVPVAATCTTLFDLGTMLLNYLGYGQDPPKYEPIGIAPIRNLENTWIVMCAGGWYELNSTHGSVSFLAAMQAGMGYQSVYSQTLLTYISNTVPGDAKLVLFGHSLGGINLENVAFNSNVMKRVLVCMTIGSPPTGVRWEGTTLRRFRVPSDPIPNFSPLGLLNWLAFDQMFITLLEDPDHPDFSENHRYEPINPALKNYDCWGFAPTGRPPMVVGVMQTFDVPVPPIPPFGG